MSYKNKKSQKGIFNQIKWRLGLVKIALLKKVARKGREKKVYLPQTRVVMRWLRERSRLLRLNNAKINIWVDEYVNASILNGRPIEMLTQFCVSKDLEQRYGEQGNGFTPTKKEHLLFVKEIPAIVEMFEKNGVRYNWWITFNRSYLDSGRINSKIESQYAAMIAALAKPLTEKGVRASWWEIATAFIATRPEYAMVNTRIETIVYKKYGKE